MTKRKRSILNIVLAAVFLFSTFMFLRQQADNTLGRNSYDNALQMAISESSPLPEPEIIPTDAATAPEDVATEPEPVWIPAPIEEEDPNLQTLEAIDLEALREANPDVIGWILIPETQIHYPLLQGEDNEYYLSHTWDGNYNTVGSIFLETNTNPELTDFNTIIYGHNMQNGSMFADLHAFGEAEFLQSHPYVYILSDQGIFRYEIFSAYLAPLDGAAYGLSFNQEQTRIRFLEEVVESSLVRTDITPEITDRFLTLSTCSGAGYSNRWVVHARLKMIQAESLSA